MITYEPFWKTIKEKNISTYKLIKEYNVSNGTLDRLRHNKHLTTLTLNDLCFFLDCKIEEIVRYTPDEDDQKL